MIEGIYFERNYVIFTLKSSTKHNKHTKKVNCLRIHSSSSWLLLQTIATLYNLHIVEDFMVSNACIPNILDDILNILKFKYHLWII